MGSNGVPKNMWGKTRGALMIERHPEELRAWDWLSPHGRRVIHLFLMCCSCRLMRQETGHYDSAVKSHLRCVAGQERRPTQRISLRVLISSVWDSPTVCSNILVESVGRAYEVNNKINSDSRSQIVLIFMVWKCFCEERRVAQMQMLALHTGRFSVVTRIQEPMIWYSQCYKWTFLLDPCSTVVKQLI